MMARPDEWMNELPPLVRAAAKGNISEAAVLLRAGSDPNEADEDGWAALHAAAAFNHLEIVELLLQAGAAVDTRSRDGFTPLLNAAKAEAPVIAALLNAGADPAAHDARLGWRPLHRFAGYANAPQYSWSWMLAPKSMPGTFPAAPHSWMRPKPAAPNASNYSSAPEPTQP
jgi:ankyrin repeat protein